MQVAQFRDRAPPPEQPIAAAHHASTFSAFGTAKGGIVHIDYPLLKKPLEIVLPVLTPAASAVTKVHLAVERWDCVIALCQHRVFAISLKPPSAVSQQPAQPQPPQREVTRLTQAGEDDATCFAADERSDQLIVGTRGRILVKKRVNPTASSSTSSSSAIRFDLQFSIELQDPCQDVCLTVDAGVRWLCISGWERTVWRRLVEVEEEAQGAQGTSSSLPLSDFVQPGRHPGEVVLCKSHTCTFASPPSSSSSVSSSVSSSTVRFSDAVWQCCVVGDVPLLVAALVNHTVEVALDTGQVLQTIPNVPASPLLHRFSFAPWDKGQVLAAGAAATSGGKKLLLLQQQLPLSAVLESLLSQAQTGLAVALARKLERRAEEDGDGALMRVLSRCKVEHACHLLQSRPSCSLDDVNHVLNLPHIIELLPTPRFISLFADTDLFDSPQHATKWLAAVFPPPPVVLVVKAAAADQYARFQPGVFSYTLQHLFLPLVLGRLRSHSVAAADANASPTPHLIDSLLLRAFVLVNKASKLSAELADQRRDFFANNACTVDESERLLLSFPEMWEDHAALLAGKGQFALGVEWLSVLGRNASRSGDGHQQQVEKYAQAAVRMLAQRSDLLVVVGGGGEDNSSSSMDWILERAPLVGVQALVDMRSFTTVQAAKDFFSKHQGQQQLLRMYLECLVAAKDGDDSTRSSSSAIQTARNELALLYLSPEAAEAANREALYQLVLRAPPAGMNFAALLGRLDKWPREQALVLDRLGRRQDAAYTLATKCSLREAEEYAARAVQGRPEDGSGGGGENVYGTVFDGLLASSSTAASQQHDAAIAFFARHSDHLGGARCLNKLPASMPLPRHHLRAFRQALMHKQQQHRDLHLEQQLLRTEHFDSLQRLTHEQAKYAVVTEADRCHQCRKPFHAHHAVFVFQSRVWHYACFSSSGGGG